MAWDERMRDFHARHLVHEVIDPAETRGDRIGRHRLARWPTKF